MFFHEAFHPHRISDEFDEILGYRCDFMNLASIRVAGSSFFVRLVLFGCLSVFLPFFLMADYPSSHSHSHHSQPGYYHHQQQHQHPEEEEATVWVPSPFDDVPIPPQQRTQSAVYGYDYGGFAPYSKYDEDMFAGNGPKKDDFAPETHYASQPLGGYEAPRQESHRGRSYTSAPSHYAPAPVAVEPPLYPEGSHVCPVCSLLQEDPLPAVVLHCPRCDSKYCFFCNDRITDNLPCAKKVCRHRCKAFWREEDSEFNRYNVKPLKDKASKRAKRKMQSAGYVAGVGACGVASAGLVAAGVAGVPFTAGFSLILIPAAIVPFEGARATLDRRRRYNMLIKDKKRQSVRSQIRLETHGNEGERGAGAASSSSSSSSFSSSSSSAPHMIVDPSPSAPSSSSSSSSASFASHSSTSFASQSSSSSRRANY
jgi:hypothetical protein